MAFLASASLRAPSPVIYSSSPSRRSSILSAVKAASTNSSHPLLTSLRLAASTAVLLAAASPAVACTPSPPPPPAPVTSAEDPTSDDSYPFEKLIVETAALARGGGAATAHDRLSAASGTLDARLVAAQALFVEGRVDEAIAAFVELAREDPADYRPVFCQGVLYTVLGRADAADLMFQRCREIAGDNFVGDVAMPPSSIEATAEAERVEADAEADA